MAKAIMREKELENVCKEQAARIEELNQLVSGFLTLIIYVCGLDFTLLTVWICPGREIERRKRSEPCHCVRPRKQQAD